MRVKPIITDVTTGTGDAVYKALLPYASALTPTFMIIVGAGVGMKAIC